MFEPAEKALLALMACHLGFRHGFNDATCLTDASLWGIEVLPSVNHLGCCRHEMQAALCIIPDGGLCMFSPGLPRFLLQRHGFGGSKSNRCCKH